MIEMEFDRELIIFMFPFITLHKQKEKWKCEEELIL